MTTDVLLFLAFALSAAALLLGIVATWPWLEMLAGFALLPRAGFYSVPPWPRMRCRGKR